MQLVTVARHSKSLILHLFPSSASHCCTYRSTMHLLKAALLLYSIIPPLLAYPFAPSTLSPRSALTDCLSSSSLSYLTPDSPNFSSSTQSFNARIQPVPQVIVFPSTPEQVAQAVQCAKARSIAVVARGGGHSYVCSKMAKRYISCSLLLTCRHHMV